MQQIFLLLNIHHDALILVHWLENIDYRIYNLLNVEIMSIFIDLIVLFTFAGYFYFVKKHYFISTFFAFLFFMTLYFFEDIALISRNDNHLNERVSSIKSYISSYFISSSIVGFFALYMKYFNVKKSFKISSKILSDLLMKLGNKSGLRIFSILVFLVIIVHNYPTIHPHGNNRLRMRYVGVLELVLNFSITVTLPISIYIILIIWVMN